MQQEEHGWMQCGKDMKKSDIFLQEIDCSIVLSSKVFPFNLIKFFPGTPLEPLLTGIIAITLLFFNILNLN